MYTLSSTVKKNFMQQSKTNWQLQIHQFTNTKLMILAFTQYIMWHMIGKHMKMNEIVHRWYMKSGMGSVTINNNKNHNPLTTFLWLSFFTICPYSRTCFQTSQQPPAGTVSSFPVVLAFLLKGEIQKCKVNTKRFIYNMFFILFTLEWGYDDNIFACILKEMQLIKMGYQNILACKQYILIPCFSWICF